MKSTFKPAFWHCLSRACIGLRRTSCGQSGKLVLSQHAFSLQLPQGSKILAVPPPINSGSTACFQPCLTGRNRLPWSGGLLRLLKWGQYEQRAAPACWQRWLLGQFALCPKYLLVLLWSQGFWQVAVVSAEFMFPAGVGEIEVLRAAEKSHFCEQCALLGAGVCTCTRGTQS